MVKPDSLNAEKLFKKAEDYWRDVRYDSSNFFYEKASLLFQENKDWQRYIDCQNNIGVNYRYLGKFADAISHLNKGIDAIDNLNENQDSIRVKLYNNTGFVYFEMGYYDKAYKYYNDMLHISKRVFGATNVNTGRGYQNIGLIYYSTGDYDKALRYVDKALSIFSADSDNTNIQLANCYSYLSKIYLQKGEYSGSIGYEEMAIKIWIDKLGEGHPFIAVSYNKLADIYSMSGNYSKALEYSYKAMQIRRDFGGEKSKDVAESYADIGNIFIQMANFNNGKYFLNNSIAIYKKIAPADPGLADAYVLSGNLFRIKSEFKTAEACYDSALYIVWPHYNPEDTDIVIPDNIVFEEQSIKALIGKAKALYAEAVKTSDWSGLGKTLNLFTIASSMIEKLKTGFGDEESEFLIKSGSYEVNSGGILAAIKLYEQTNNPEYIESAFKFAERNKAGIMTESITKSDIKKILGIPDSLIVKENELKADISLYEAKIKKAEQSNNQEAVVVYRNLLSDSKENFNELAEYFEQNFPSYYSLKFAGEINSTDDLKKLLPPDAVLLEYFIGETTLTIFVISNSSLSAVTVNCDSAFLENITKLRLSLSELNYMNYLSSAFDLYADLIKPVKNFLRNKEKLFIIPDKILAYLPFELLLTRPPPAVFNADFKDLPYLINDYSISYQYSAGLLKDALLNKKNNLNKSFAGFVPGHFYNEEISDTGSSDITVNKYSPDPETEIQVQSIADLFEDNDYKSDIFADKFSIDNQLKQDKSHGYKFIHFAVQAIINDGNSGNSGIDFYDSNDSADIGTLYVGDIFNIQLNTDLLVMSKCEVKLGAEVKGEGIYGLTRSLQYVGAENIVIPLWQINDKSVSVFMINFYKNILDGMDYVSALRKTKLDMIQEEQYSYPLEWSPYILVGK